MAEGKKKSKKAGVGLKYAQRRAADGREARNAIRRVMRGFKQGKGRDAQALAWLTKVGHVKPTVLDAIAARFAPEITAVAIQRAKHRAAKSAARSIKVQEDSRRESAA